MGGVKCTFPHSDPHMGIFTYVVSDVFFMQALDAKYEAHVVCRLESHDNRISEQDAS